MGRIGNSFKREIGKNAGKAVSNFIFGDSHSTPYRRVGGNSEAQKVRAEAQQTRADAEMERVQAQISKQEKDDLNLLDAAVLQNVDIVLQTMIPQNESDLQNLMSIWSAQLSGSKWDYQTEEGKIRNQFPDALVEKFTQCTLIMKSVAPANPMIGYYDNILIEATKRRNKAKTKQRRKTLWTIFFVFLGIVFFFFLFCLAVKPF